MPRLRAIALSDCISLITAWANDASYDSVFKEQLQNQMNRGDVVLGISASGNSANVLRAVEYARSQGAITIGWTGQSGGKLKDIVDHCVHSPSDDVSIIESVHVVLDHLVANQLLHRIQGDGKTSEQPHELARKAICREYFLSERHPRAKSAFRPSDGASIQEANAESRSH
jgi:fructoselysine-6-P-deglycase FrlB-like protein